MRSGRMLVIIGLIVLLGAVAVAAIFLVRRPSPAPVPGEGEAVATPLPEGVREIVVAAQNIPRGSRIGSDAVQIASWPETAVPEGTLTNVEDALGRVTRVEVLRGMPIIQNMLAEAIGDLAKIGSDAAVQVPSGKVAYALPVSRYSSVAWAIQPGDHVDAIISLLVLELDEEFQTALPNSFSCVQPPQGEECQGGVLGRFEVLPNGWVVNVTPGGEERPRLVTQLTVQDAVVLRVGDWIGEVQPTPPPEEQVAEEGQQQPVQPERAAVEPLTLIVTPQDAMVLKYAEEVGASIDLVLRSTADADKVVTTDMVTLQYIFNRFKIELPPQLPYGVTPPLKSLPAGAASEAAGGGGERVGE